MTAKANYETSFSILIPRHAGVGYTQSVRGQNQKAVMMLKFLHEQATLYLQEFFTERGSYYDLQPFLYFFDCTC